MCSVCIFVIWPYHCIVLFCLRLCLLFFFFKQKTAYEMRISDWSSDVCSSDLRTSPVNWWSTPPRTPTGRAVIQLPPATLSRAPPIGVETSEVDSRASMSMRTLPAAAFTHSRAARSVTRRLLTNCGASRSEEHTSELQSLMRISYAVFCFQKKHI